MSKIISAMKIKHVLKLLAYVSLNEEADSFYRDALHNTSDSDTYDIRNRRH
jgi:hypothetical protein